MLDAGTWITLGPRVGGNCWWILRARWKRETLTFPRGQLEPLSSGTIWTGLWTNGARTIRRLGHTSTTSWMLWNNTWPWSSTDSWTKKGGVSILVNGNEVESWNPFMTGHPSTQRLPAEDLALPTGAVRVQPFVLPHHSRLTDEEHRRQAGIRGWNQHQGFYVYRAHRLLVSGTWFYRDMKAEEHRKLARIAIDISQAMDHEWDIDVRKSKARPPAALKEDLVRIARATRRRAAEVYRHRGKRVSKELATRSLVLVWERYRKNQEIFYRINRKHDVVLGALDGPHDQRARVRALLELIEKTIPVPTIAVDAFERPDEQGDRRVDSLSSDEIQVAREVMRGHMENGESRDNSVARVMMLEPFAQHPELAEILTEEI